MNKLRYEAPSSEVIKADLSYLVMASPIHTIVPKIPGATAIQDNLTDNNGNTWGQAATTETNDSDTWDISNKDTENEW